jgi:phytoene dehydrogenase-like protein
MPRTANVIGSGPNGLAAAITLAKRGVAVTVYERNTQPGGACATGEITLPGFHHDLGSSVYPLGVASPFFQSLPLAQYGLRWIEPPAALAHPFDDGSAVLLEHSLEQTAAQFAGHTSEQFGRHTAAHDLHAWSSLFAPTVRDWPRVVEGVLHPLLRMPRNPVAMATFGMAGILPAQALAKLVFNDVHARALFAGCAAHSVLPLTHVGSAATGVVLVSAAHTTGWPIVAGGAQQLTSALVAYFEALGGRIVLNAEVRDLAELPEADATLFDTSTSALMRLAGAKLSPSFCARLRRFKSGPGIFKLDWALDAPIPWANMVCARAATVHLGGTMEEIARSEHDAFYGHRNQKPFVLLVQPSLFDRTRAPAGKHTAWAYCHVPAGCNDDMTNIIESQVERFAPGFRDVVLARRASNATALEAWNPNLAGGDVSGGAMTLEQLAFRPTARAYATSHPRIFLCSASTPPGGGVHGMCGHQAAMTALRSLE